MAPAILIERPMARTRPHRITVDLSPEQLKWLAMQRAEDRITTADRLRTLINRMMVDPAFTREVAEQAQQEGADQ